MSDADAAIATSQQRVREALDRTEFDRDAYQDPAYLQRALEAGLSIETLATAHEVTERTLYRILETNEQERPEIPRNGPARTLWEASPDSIPGDD